MATARRNSGNATLAGGLRADQRGAVMVVGVFMAAFLVGSLWYIIGIGDAILFRERMQDGADAVAFSAAVYHARGMNIIAMINIIMAAILGILIAFKLVQLINSIAMAVSCALCYSIGGSAVACPICGFTTGFSPVIADAVATAEQMVNVTLPILSKTQVGVAVAMPWIAQDKAKTIASTQYTEPVQEGGFISVSLVPFVPTERLGLPVQEEPYSKLCERAGTYVGELVFSPFGSFGGWISGVVGSIVSTFPGYFCNATGGWGNSQVTGSISQSGIEAAAQKACKEKKDKLSGKAKKKFDMSDCVDDAKKEVEDELAKQQGGQSGISGDDKTSKEVFWAAKNGNGYFQIWSVLVGNDEWPRKAEKGVEIAAWNQSMTMPDMPWGKVAFAQAEYYYDDAGSWDDLKQDAMWNMFWRARLRRVRVPSSTVSGILQNEVIGAVAGKIGPQVSSVLGGAEIGLLLGNGSGEAFKKSVGAVHQGGGPWKGQYTKNPKLANDGEIEVVH